MHHYPKPSISYILLTRGPSFLYYALLLLELRQFHSQITTIHVSAVARNFQATVC